MHRLRPIARRFPRLAGAGEGDGKCQVVPRCAGSAPRDDHPSVGDGGRFRLSAAVPGHTAEVATELLQELLWACGPSGQEDAVRDICRRELQPVVDESWIDEAGNLVGLIRADPQSTRTPRSAVRVMAHMDELSMLVKRIEPDGTLHLTPLDTMYPGNFGLGPVAIPGRHATVCPWVRNTPRRKATASGRPNPTKVTRPWTGRTSTSHRSHPR